MSSSIRHILEQVERGELDCQGALREISYINNPHVIEGTKHLQVRVSNLHDDRARVYVRIPLSMVEFGLNIGSYYTPELKDLDIDSFISELSQVNDGALVEVEDFDEGERVIISIESNS
ncbi:MAG: hypothetical protein GTO18_16045 [Anaerolineales bacterium]|nr:hypothetical protein [Anaerolineales bacterium]